MAEFTFRDATFADAEAIARVHVEAFIETHGGLHPPSIELRRRQWSELLAQASPDGFCVAVEEAGAGLVGFARGQPHRSESLPFAGELNKIYLLRRVHRLGLGRRLMAEVANRFLERGIGSMLLFGDARNLSNGFYERLGGERIYAANGEFHGGYGWKDLKGLLDPEA